MIFDQPTTWDDANTICKEHGMTLTKIQNQAKEDSIVKLLKNQTTR